MTNPHSQENRQRERHTHRQTDGHWHSHIRNTHHTNMLVNIPVISHTHTVDKHTSCAHTRKQGARRTKGQISPHIHHIQTDRRAGSQEYNRTGKHTRMCTCTQKDTLGAPLPSPSTITSRTSSLNWRTVRDEGSTENSTFFSDTDDLTNREISCPPFSPVLCARVYFYHHHHHYLCCCFIIMLWCPCCCCC